MIKNNASFPASEVRIATVSANEAGQRIDNYLLRVLKGVPRSMVYRILRTGQVRVNKGRIKPTYKVKAGDEVRIPPVRQADPEQARNSPPPDRVFRQLQDRIIFEDARLLAINKPAGMAVHGGSGLSFGVIEALRAMRPDAPYLELVHRLDRETSGVLLIAKKRSALRRLHQLLREGGMEKRYLTLLAGSWSLKREEVRLTLNRSERGGERMVNVSDAGKEAVSRFRALEYFPGATFMEVEIDTGRTHQIRVQAAHYGHPVLGDDKYGDREANREFRKLGLRRMFLHSVSVGFTWPESEERLDVHAPLDDDLRAVMDTLEARR